MPRKYEISQNDEALIFTPDKGPAERMEFLPMVSIHDAIKIGRQEVQARGKQTAAAMSIIVEVLSSTRMMAHIGGTALGESISPEIKDKMREIEDDLLKADFLASLPQSLSAEKRADEWTKYSREYLRSAGTYANCRSVSLKYFTQIGRLPVAHDANGTPDRGRILPVSAMQKILSIETQKAHANDPEKDKSLAGKVADILKAMMDKKDDLTIKDLENIAFQAGRLAQEATELRNIKNVAVTQALAQGGQTAGESAPKTAPESVQTGEPAPAEPVKAEEPATPTAESAPTKGKRQGKREAAVA